MKKAAMMMGVILFMPFLTAQQNVNTIKRPVSGFTKLSVYGDMVIYLTKGKTESMEIEIPDEVAPNKITTGVENGELKIKSTYGLLKDKKKIKAYVTFKELTSISAGGSGEVVLPDSVLKTSSLKLNAYTGGVIDVAVDVKELTAEVSEKAVITLEGYALNQTVTASLGGVYSAYEMESEDATVKALTKGIVKVNSTMSLNATVTTGGWVGYLTDPKYKFFTPKNSKRIVKIEENEK